MKFRVVCGLVNITEIQVKIYAELGNEHYSNPNRTDELVLISILVLLFVGVCSGWSCYLSRCYYVYTDNVDHPTARDRCHSMNAELVSISDEDEKNFVGYIW